jgi:hypothetical protein
VGRGASNHDGWIFEKVDGWRLLAYKAAGK